MINHDQFIAFKLPAFRQVDREADMGQAKRDAGAVDEVAASIILRTYLATRRVNQDGSRET